MMPLLTVHDLFTIINRSSSVKEANTYTRGAPRAGSPELHLPSLARAHSAASMPTSCPQIKTWRL